MVALPALSALIAFGCVAVIGRDARRRPSPDRITWMVAFALFGIAAGAEVIGDTAGWTAPLARLYYLTGAVLVVGFLAMGQLYLLAADKIRRVAPGAALLITAISASTVWGAPIDRSRLADDGWDAIERTTGLKVLSIGINSIGTLILIGGLAYSAIRFQQSGTHRNRMIGCLLIALGTLAVAMGGTLTRLGSDQYLYIAMSAGIGLIFGGYLHARRRDQGEQALRRAGELVERPAVTSRDPQPATLHPGITFIEERLRTLSDDDLSEECRIWSVTPRDIDAFNRAEARRVWSFRNRLSPEGQTAFDSRPVGIRLQLTELYFEVMSADVPAVERPAVAPLDRLTSREHADAPSVRAASGSVD